MRVLIQRVSEASVVVDDDTIGQIDNGLLVLVCAMDGDTDEQAEYLARKVAIDERGVGHRTPPYTERIPKGSEWKEALRTKDVREAKRLAKILGMFGPPLKG